VELPVTVVEVSPTDVPLTGEWVGTLDGYVNAQIQPQANGYLIKQNYREGAQVAKGQVLFEIDPRPFQAALDQANGAVGPGQGAGAAGAGAARLAEINVNRDTPLAQAHAPSRRASSITIRSRRRRLRRVKSAQASSPPLRPPLPMRS
jgi:membrane fusion protein (multidrug efflux system)